MLQKKASGFRLPEIERSDLLDRFTNRGTYYGDVDIICTTGIYPRYEDSDDKHSAYYGQAIDRLAKYEDTGLAPEQVEEIFEIFSKNLLNPEFPCRIGDIVYEIGFGRIPIPQEVTGFRIGNLMEDDEDNEEEYSDTEWNVDLKTRGMQSSVRLSKFGKTLFLTREEAEKAMQQESDPYKGNE